MFLNKGNLKYTFLQDGIDDTETAITVRVGTGASYTDAPCLSIITQGLTLPHLLNAEQIKVTAKGVDQDEWTIVRNNDGRGARSHVAGEMIIDVVSAEHFVDLESVITQLAKFVTLAMGTLSSGVINTAGDYSELKVIPTDPESLQYKVQVGNCFVDYWPVSLTSEYTSSAISAIVTPGNTKKILVQISKYGVISHKESAEGASPTTPAVDADNFSLGVITLTDSDVIAEEDIADVRTFY